ncbi:hypothetical protein FO519_009383, partial [Halicephalobus sp. NKZ332]
MRNNILKFAILAIILYQFAASVPLNLHSFDIEKVRAALAANPKASVTCDVCKLLIGGIQLLLEQNKTDQEIDKFAIDTCINFKIEQPYACRMIVEEFGDEIYFVLENSFLEPHEFCGLFVKNCSQAENPFDQPWPLKIPGDKPAVKPWPIPEEYDTRGPQWLYTVLNEQWGHWLPDTVKETIQYRGSYSFRPFKGLKMISLNTVYCSKWNFYLYVNATDPDETLEWLTSELLDSEKAGEKVHILSHIPSGDSYCLKAWAANYYQLVNRFENTLAA